jgi:hypothetical protein
MSQMERLKSMIILQVNNANHKRSITPTPVMNQSTSFQDSNQLNNESMDTWTVADGLRGLDLYRSKE